MLILDLPCENKRASALYLWKLRHGGMRRGEIRYSSWELSIKVIKEDPLGWTADTPSATRDFFFLIFFFPLFHLLFSPCFLFKMRGVQIFSGNSHPGLADTICERLGTVPAKANLGKFANGETSVNIGTSVRNQDVYIIQSGSEKINDSVMELLIMISACKGGSAKSITGMFVVVLIAFPANQFFSL